MRQHDYISILKSLYQEKINFIDVGAYKGDFTDGILYNFAAANCVLIEPTVENYDYLQEKYKDEKRVNLLNVALSNTCGVQKFFSTDDTAQNSLLPHRSYSVNCKEHLVQVRSLDQLILETKMIDQIDFIKIDTQGNDLNVLMGSEKCIEKYSPAILSEIIFIPLYEGQSSFIDQFKYLKDINYNISGMYNLHYTFEGILAYADVLFLPENRYKNFIERIDTSSNFVCLDPYVLSREIDKLNTTCDERLKLINYLSDEAQNRLDIINQLNSEIERLRVNK